MPKSKATPRSIGGYFELQLTPGSEYYPNLIKLNTGRNALEYILKQKGYTKIYIPYFTCDVILEPITRLNVEYQFYSINEQLEPVIDFTIEPHACFLYTDYFGVKREAVKRLSKQIKHIIIDNSQSFFSEALPGIDTFYSCRKFFGVPDGAYLQIRKKLSRKLPVDSSLNRFSHLIKSIEQGTEAGYADFKANNEDLENNEIKSMSLLTQKILSGIDYAECARIRKRNFDFLHKHLEASNLFKFDIADDCVPMVYPFLHNAHDLKVHLIQKKIFVATYWPNVFKWTSKKMYENYLARCLVPLPIDHRYNLQDMFFMLTILQQFI